MQITRTIRYMIYIYDVIRAIILNFMKRAELECVVYRFSNHEMEITLDLITNSPNFNFLKFVLFIDICPENATPLVISDIFTVGISVNISYFTRKHKNKNKQHYELCITLK